jgi:hypothetical protein
MWDCPQRERIGLCSARFLKTNRLPRKTIWHQHDANATTGTVPIELRMKTAPEPARCANVDQQPCLSMSHSRQIQPNPCCFGRYNSSGRKSFDVIPLDFSLNLCRWFGPAKVHNFMLFTKGENEKKCWIRSSLCSHPRSSYLVSMTCFAMLASFHFLRHLAKRRNISHKLTTCYEIGWKHWDCPSIFESKPIGSSGANQEISFHCSALLNANVA